MPRSDSGSETNAPPFKKKGRGRPPKVKPNLELKIEDEEGSGQTPEDFSDEVSDGSMETHN